MRLHELAIICFTFLPQLLNGSIIPHRAAEKAARNFESLSRLRRAYKDSAGDNAYIRFGKRQMEQADVPDLQSSKTFLPLPEHRSESAYIRFGKRGFMDQSGPCTLNYLRALPNQNARLNHLQGCSINRDTRGHDDGYIRFGKRSGLPSTAMDLVNDKCFYIIPYEEKATIRECSDLSKEEINMGVMILFP